ncbi:MAG: tagaturonate epimerase family protein, partial [Candidatus Atribacteria bacterium]|nr:tagaturonate epimerase family protein [Candidatus Atribacteria bacterium]
SPRELVKTGRSFPDVLLGAAFGMLESGFSRPFGADADHIKDETYLNQGIESGFSFYTLDASEVMNRQAFFLSEVELGQAYQRLTPDQLQTYKRYIDRTIRLNDDFQIGFLENRLLPILLAYDPVLHFVEKMNSILDERCPVYDLEISMDEGDALTSPEAHFFVTEELHRRGIDFQSVAPKFPGSFEKGIDYVGDTKEFTRSLRKHAMIQRMVGGYRLSLHSGSDKFSIYSVFNQETEGLFHLKTSGTSWLKALETVARHDPELFRKIYDLSRVELPENRKAYVISVREQDIQLDLESIPDKKLPDLFQNDKVRQLLHISYGSILRDFQSSLYQILFWEEDDHYHLVKEHIGKHLELLLGKKKR